MKEISKLLKDKNIITHSYKKIGNVFIVDTNKGKYVLKKKSNKDYIYNYLDTRNFNYYPKIYDLDNYTLTEYVEDINIPDEQRIIDLIDLTSLLHNKTTHYRETTEDDYKKIYEDLSNNYEYLYEYYNDLITIIDSHVFMSPSEYLLSRNISFIFNSITEGKKYVENFLSNVSDRNKMRVSIVHNNLDLSHYIRNNHEYLISWDKSKIDIPVFDLYILYNKNYALVDFYEILKRYEKNYPLKKYELELFFILITMPSKIELNDTEYNMCYKISNEIDRLYKSHDLIEQYKKSIVSN